MSSTLRRAPILLTTVTVLAVMGGASAQDPSAAQGPVLTVPSLEARIQSIADDTAIGEELRTRLLETYNRALEAVRTADQHETETLKFVEERAEAPTLVEKLRQELATLVAAPPAAQPATDTQLSELEARLAQAQQEMDRATRESEALDQQANQRAERRNALPGLIEQARQELAAHEAQPPIEDPQPALEVARRAAREAQQRALLGRVRSLEAEQAEYEATDQVLEIKRDLAKRRAAAAIAFYGTLNERVQQARLQQAQRAQAEAEQRAQQAQDRHPALARLAEQNAALARQRTQLTERQSRTDTELLQVRQTLANLQKDFEEIKLRVEQIGLTYAIGTQLRARRTQLPDTGRGFLRATAAQREEISDTQAARFELDDRREELTRSDHLDDLLSDLDAETPPARAASIRSEARALLEEQVRTIDELRLAYSRHFDQLVNLDIARHRLRDLAQQYGDYIKERVLWVRSTVALWKMDWSDVAEATKWLVLPENWGAAGESLLRELKDTPVLGAALLLALGLLVLRRHLRRRLRDLGGLASRGSTVAYRPTFVALLHTALLASSLPALPLLVGAILEADPDGEAFSRALGDGLLIAGVFTLGLEFVRQMVREQGLAQCHFQWQAHKVAVLRRTVLRLEWVLLPALLIAGTLESHGFTPWRITLSRIAFSAVMVALALFCWRLLHPRRGLLADGGRTLAQRLSGLWLLLAVGTPLALLGMATTGYYFTALQLLLRVESTLVLLFVAVLAYALVMRRLVLTRRAMAIRQTKERMQAARQAGGDKPEPEAGEEQVRIDPSTVALQTRKLLRAALWIGALLVAYGIWVDVLPALGMLRQWVLWSDASTDPVTSITMAHLLGSMLLLLGTILAARNIPGFLDLLVFQRVKVQPGERNAIATLVRYFIYVFGLLAAFSAIGIGWSKVQWLVAAMSVGLGFGLQEIFANFVSGLILLFERPIRPGDIVTVGDLHGKVQRIRIRATTILDWDRKELIVPNKEFVSGRFVNWTLSDSIVRAIVPVGVAYGSDTERAQQVMLDVARAHPLVLKDPAPRAVFRRFGDSTLDLELRVYLSNYDDYPQLQTDLHTQVDLEFRKHGIEIAFPQRDLHIRSARPLVEVLDRAEARREERVLPETS